ncbi:hypothetical protein [Acidithiobacillus thiooxidans]|uniref:hypothetical protein n=1 Tax=Acidithiobacillus thiooxidans TaxID=930 RepID=UPI001D01A16C|nr:hypothetical protein [Acidithiobacillus thiooxidans]
MGTGLASGPIESKFFPSQARLGVWVGIFRDFRTSILTCGAMQRVFLGHSFATQQTDKSLAYVLEKLLSALANSAELGGYAHEKLSAAFKCLQQYLMSIGENNHLDEGFEWNIHELLTIPVLQLEPLVANRVDGSLDYHAIRLISGLLQHRKINIDRKSLLRIAEHGKP